MLLFIKVLTLAKFLKLQLLLFLLHSSLILSDAAKEQAILVLLLSILDHLHKLVSDSVSDSLKELALLATEDRHGILGESQKDPLVAKALVS